jgi:hypothetical protein
MSVSTDGDDEPSVALTPGQLLDARLLLDDQTFDAIDDQHRRLAARVDALEAVVAMFEELLLRPSVLPGTPGVPSQAHESACPPRAQHEQGWGGGRE